MLVSFLAGSAAQPACAISAFAAYRRAVLGEGTAFATAAIEVDGLNAHDVGHLLAWSYCMVSLSQRVGFAGR